AGVLEGARHRIRRRDPEARRRGGLAASLQRRRPGLLGAAHHHPRGQARDPLHPRLLHRAREHRDPGAQARPRRAAPPRRRRAVAGATYSDHYANDETRPEVQAFVARFEAEYKQPPGDVLAALGYDAARVLFDAIKRAGSTNGDAIAKALAATRDFHGVTGLLTMDAQRNPTKSAVIVQIRNGKPHWVATISP